MKPAFTFADFEKAVEDFAHYPGSGERDALAVAYCALGLSGEAGEVNNDIKKAIRDEKLGQQGKVLTLERRERIRADLGDVLWYAARLAYEVGTTLEDVARGNVTKCDARIRQQAADGSEVALQVLRKRRARLS